MNWWELFDRRATRNREERESLANTRKREWDEIYDKRIAGLADQGGTPLNDEFSQGLGVPGLADYVAALERRVDELERKRGLR